MILPGPEQLPGALPPRADFSSSGAPATSRDPSRGWLGAGSRHASRTGRCRADRCATVRGRVATCWRMARSPCTEPPPRVPSSRATTQAWLPVHGPRPADDEPAARTMTCAVTWPAGPRSRDLPPPPSTTRWQIFPV